jgi:hypothetical protein
MELQMDPQVTADDLARAVSEARQHSDTAAMHEHDAARRADEADRHADQAAIHADHAAHHEQVAATAAALTQAHEHESLMLLEQARGEEEETHQLRQQAHVLLVKTQAHEHEAAQMVARLEHERGQVATDRDRPV